MAGNRLTFNRLTRDIIQGRVTPSPWRCVSSQKVETVSKQEILTRAATAAGSSTIRIRGKDIAAVVKSGKLNDRASAAGESMIGVRGSELLAAINDPPEAVQESARPKQTESSKPTTQSKAAAAK